VWTERDFPQQWAGTQNNLGAVHAELPTGNRGFNVAIAAQRIRGTEIGGRFSRRLPDRRRKPRSLPCRRAVGTQIGTGQLSIGCDGTR
jgi:hypothetical protein